MLYVLHAPTDRRRAPGGIGSKWVQVVVCQSSHPSGFSGGVRPPLGTDLQRCGRDDGGGGRRVCGQCGTYSAVSRQPASKQWKHKYLGKASHLS